MRILGFILLGLGFILSALSATINKEMVNWNYFVPCMVVGVVGVVLLRISIKKQQKGESKVEADIAVITESLKNIAQNITTFNGQKGESNVYDIHSKIDELFIDDIENFLKARESIIHHHSMEVYADLMNHFAAGERYLNRAWSASADGYVDEVNASIEKACEQFVLAKKQFEGL